MSEDSHSYYRSIFRRHEEKRIRETSQPQFKLCGIPCPEPVLAGIRECILTMLVTAVLCAMSANGGTTTNFVYFGSGLASLMVAWFNWFFARFHSAEIGITCNPFITLAQGVLGKIPWYQPPINWIGQYAGAFLGTLIAYYVIGVEILDAAPHIGVGYGEWYACFAETIGVTIVVMVYIAANTAGFAGISTLIVGVTTAALGLALGPISGAVLNSARALATQAIGQYWVSGWVWHVGSVFGAAIGIALSLLLKLYVPVGIAQHQQRTKEY